MAYNFSIEVTSGVAATEVPDELAKELAEIYAKLSELPSNRAVNIDFSEAKEAREFVRQGKSWAESQGLVFARKGNVKDNPTRVTFRVYAPGSGRGRKPGKK